ncbi:MAG TPA: flagellin [Symbiobacteriaceae bacterium]|nr:flagellin [Symbiobacteriaceae bacterium]
MRIRSNWTALRTVRALNTAVNAGDANLEKLSMGIRVRRASDDAAGLGIAQRLRAQYMGLMRANRNAADGLNLVKTADSALGEVHGILQRLRELAVKSGNNTWDATDISIMQSETNDLLREIDRIADSVKWNGADLISKGGNSSVLSDLLYGLQNGWLEQAAQVIQNAYGITGDGAPLEIVFEQSGAQPTWVTGTPNPGTGAYDNLQMHVNLSMFESGGAPDGGNGPFYHDRKIARALTEAIISRNSNMTNLAGSDYWFVSGASSLISGYDAELAAAVTQYGAAAVVNAINTPWVDDDLHRASAYLSAKYLEGTYGAGTMQLTFMNLGGGTNLNGALLGSIGTGLPLYLSDFMANGVAFLGTLNLNDADVGGFFSGNASAVIPNGGTYNSNPLDPNFSLSFGMGGSNTPMKFNLQVGANANDKLMVEYSQVNTFTLGLTGINLATNHGKAIQLYDAAINQVSTTRTALGAAANRLESVMNTNGWSTEGQLGGYSRIVDLDMAREVSDLAKNQLLRDSATAMLVQANVTSENMITLMDAMPSLFDLAPTGVQAHSIAAKR